MPCSWALLGGVVCFFAATMLKHELGYDDSLDAFGVHGVGGTLGAILTGVFAVAAINTARPAWSTAIPAQVLNQFLATVMTWGIAAVRRFVLLKIVDAIVGLRVSEDDEYDGLDLTQHGESGYNLDETYSAIYHSTLGSIEEPAANPAATAKH